MDGIPSMQRINQGLDPWKTRLVALFICTLSCCCSTVALAAVSGSCYVNRILTTFGGQREAQIS